jgi:hypothetical protein
MNNDDPHFDAELFKIGSHGYHEILHTSRVVADLFERDILDHPSVQMYEDIHIKAQAISEKLEELYQFIGLKTGNAKG